MQVHVINDCGAEWFRLPQANANVWVKGFAFRNEALVEGLNLAKLFVLPEGNQDKRRGIDQFKCALKELNGNFAVIVKYDGWLLAAVDHIRSIPLFYGKADNKFFLSDDAAWIRRETKCEQRDTLACAEFLLSSYVTGRDTLFASVKQIQAGEMIVVENNRSGEGITAHRYYRFLRGDYLSRTQKEFLEHFDVVFKRAIRRLITSAKGRTLVVPLSGGYDSRIIVLLLLRLGYDNIVAFSYGLSGNREASISKQIAETLGLRWEFIPYSRSQWRNWFHSSERKAYYCYADGLSSLPHLQDWPAVKVLRQDRLIPEDSVFVPGHTGDFIGGGHVPQRLYNGAKHTVDAGVLAVLQKHFALNSIRALDIEVQSELERRIRNIIGEVPPETPDRAINAYESWEWQERQAKFIVNSCRVYEFWRYEWRMPLWDQEITGFWERVPVRYRAGKTLYNTYVDQQSAAIGLPDANPKGTLRKLGSKTLARLNLTKCYVHVVQALRALQCERVYNNHFLGWYGVMPKRVFKQFYSGTQHLYSYLVQEYLGKIQF